MIFQICDGISWFIQGRNHSVVSFAVILLLGNIVWTNTYKVIVLSQIGIKMFLSNDQYFPKWFQIRRFFSYVCVLVLHVLIHFQFVDFFFFNWLQKSIIHIGRNRFGCPYCPKEMKHSTNMRRHIMIHTGEKPLSCQLCDYSANQRSHLSYHMKNYHKQNA